MRVIAALALFVSLAATCLANDWLTANTQGTEAFKQGRWAEAVTAFEEALPLAGVTAERAVTSNNLGQSLHSLARYGEALPWFERAVALWNTLPGHSAELMEAALGLIDDYRAVGRFQEAERSALSALSLNPSGRQRGTLLTILGDMQREQSRKQEAAGTFRAALAVEGLTTPDRIDALLGLADIDRGLGNWAAGIEKANRAVGLARGTGSVLLESLGLRILGLTWTDSGDLAAAEPALRRSLALIQKEADAPYRQVAASLTCLGQLYKLEGKYAMAEESWLAALAIERKHGSEAHPQAAVGMESLAGLYCILKRYGDANDLAAGALTIMSAAFGLDSVPAAEALATVALVQQVEKRSEAAAASYEQALATMRAKGAPSDRNILDVMDRYATVLATLHRNDEAKRLRQEIKTFRLR